MFKKGMILATITCLCFSLVGCSAPKPEPILGSTPLTQDTTAYTVGNVDFIVPSNWRQKDGNTGVYYFYPTETTAYSFMAKIEDHTGGPFTDSSIAGYVSGLKDFSPDIQHENLKDVYIDGLSGFSFRFSATLDETPMRFYFVVLVDNAYMYSFTYVTMDINNIPYDEAVQKIIDSIKVKTPPSSAYTPSLSPYHQYVAKNSLSF